MDIVLFSTADWDNPFWTNKQHVALQLNKQGHRVFYIDSIGLRRPSANPSDIDRIAKRILKACSSPKIVRENLLVWSPFLIPFHRFNIITKINYTILNKWLHYWLRKLKFKPQLLWTYNPITMKLLDTTMFDNIVYHCVDEIKEQPGMPHETIMEAEEKLVSTADIVFVTSQSLLETRKQLNSRTYYFPNVADYDHFSKAMLNSTAVPDDLDNIPKPRIGFVGAISGYKVDIDLIAYVAKMRPKWSLVLIGKVGEGDPWTKTSAIKDLPNVINLGPRPYAQLPAYLKGIDVAILPNLLNAYTRAMFPMKFFEYLAAGKPIVSVNLPALRQFSDIVYLAKNYNDFIIGIEKALNDDNSEAKNKRCLIASKYTYKTRTEQMMSIIENYMSLRST